MRWSGQLADKEDYAMVERSEGDLRTVLKEIKRIIQQDGQDFTDGEIIDQISGLLETGYWYFIENIGEK
jgi:hypothetical protein